MFTYFILFRISLEFKRNFNKEFSMPCNFCEFAINSGVNSGNQTANNRVLMANSHKFQSGLHTDLTIQGMVFNSDIVAGYRLTGHCLPFHAEKQDELFCRSMFVGNILQKMNSSTVKIFQSCARGNDR